MILKIMREIALCGICESHLEICVETLVSLLDEIPGFILGKISGKILPLIKQKNK